MRSIMTSDELEAALARKLNCKRVNYRRVREIAGGQPWRILNRIPWPKWGFAQYRWKEKPDG
jgi:hypothetical protein